MARVNDLDPKARALFEQGVEAFLNAIGDGFLMGLNDGMTLMKRAMETQEIARQHAPTARDAQI